MTGLSNSSERYGWVAIVLHWGMAVLLVILVILGFYMVTLPDAGYEVRKIELIFLHKNLGVLAFALITLRLAWRVSNTLPELVATLPDWQKLAARYVHLCFYGVIFALPVTGWLMSSAAGIPVTLPGMTLPDLIPRDELLFRRYIVIHRWLGFALTGLFFIHAGAALMHHFLLGDDTLRRMLPRGRHRAPPPPRS